LRVLSFLLFAMFVLAGCTDSNAVSQIEIEDETEAEVQADLETGSSPEVPTPRWKPEASEKFDLPWPTDVTIDELINTALYRSNEFFDDVRVPDCVVPYRLHLGDPMLDVHKPMVEELVLNTTELFCDYLDSELIVIGGNYDYVLEVMAENQYPGDEFGGVCGFPVENDYASACAYKGVAWIGSSWGRTLGGEVFTEGRRITIAAHEIFHLIHDGLDPNAAGQSPPPGSPNFRPVWYIEGGGEFFGRIIASYLDLYPYDRFTPTDRSGLFLDVSYLSDLELLEVSQQRAFGTENYFSGQRAMEYMVASKGVGAVLQVWENLGEGMNFYEAFESAMGLTVEEFYEKFRTMHTNLYETDLVTNEY
jgi:hypothetical protein